MTRYIKAFLFGAAGLFVIITLFSLVIPSTVKVSRTVLINNTTASNIYGQAANIYNWKNWHPLFKNNPVKISPGNAQNGNSFRIEYNSKQVDIDFIPADTNTVRFSLHVPGENEILNEIIITAVPGQTNVQVEWRALNKLKWYPWEKFYGIFIDKFTGPGYEAALNGLKTYLETGN